MLGGLFSMFSLKCCPRFFGGTKYFLQVNYYLFVFLSGIMWYSSVDKSHLELILALLFNTSD